MKQENTTNIDVNPEVLYNLIWEAYEKKLEQAFLTRQQDPKVLLEQYNNDCSEVVDINDHEMFRVKRQ